jgi:hypothetical protein
MASGGGVGCAWVQLLALLGKLQRNHPYPPPPPTPAYTPLPPIAFVQQ